tara:strand:- start:157 stop:2319 length:2163 start_codon:yes stop_codon:yes gene_type:complete
MNYSTSDSSLHSSAKEASPSKASETKTVANENYKMAGITVKKRRRQLTTSNTYTTSFDKDGDGKLDEHEYHTYLYSQWIKHQQRREDAGTCRLCLIGSLRLTILFTCASLIYTAVIAASSLPMLSHWNRFQRVELQLDDLATVGEAIHEIINQESFNVLSFSISTNDNFTSTSTKEVTEFKTLQFYHFDYPSMRRFSPWVLRTLSLGSLEFNILDLSILLPSSNVSSSTAPHVISHLLQTSGRSTYGNLYNREKQTQDHDHAWYGRKCEYQTRTSKQQLQITATSGWNCTAEQKDHSIDTNTPLLLTFTILNGIISFVTTLWILNGLRHMSIRWWADAMSNIGREFFNDDFQKHYNKTNGRKRRISKSKDIGSIAPETMNKKDVIATPPPMAIHNKPLTFHQVNPFFLADSLVSSSIVDCEIQIGAAIRSSFLHVVFIVLPLVPIVCFIVFHGCTQNDLDPWIELHSTFENEMWCVPDGILQGVLLSCIFLHILLWCSYAFSYHLDLWQSIQQLVLQFSMVTLSGSLIVSTFYATNVLMWLTLSLLITPAKSLALILLILSGPIYVYFAFTEFRTLQLSFGISLKSMKATKKATQDASKEAGIDQITVVSMIVVGALIIIFLVVFLFLGFVIFANRKESGGGGIGQLATASATAYGGISSLKSQLANAKEKMENGMQKFHAGRLSVIQSGKGIEETMKSEAEKEYVYSAGDMEKMEEGGI